MKILLLMIGLVIGGCEANRNTPSGPEELRIVSLNAAFTETLFRLGLGVHVVGVDVTSTVPAAVRQRENVGHVRNLSIEGIAGLNPSHIVFANGTVPAQSIKQLSALKVNMVGIDQTYSLDGIKSYIQSLGSAFDRRQGADSLMQLVHLPTDSLRSFSPIPHVVFIYARGLGRLMVSGRGTSVDKMIQLAGLKNAITEFEQYKPLTAEALVAAQPDVLLLFESGTQSVNGIDGVLDLPGVKLTPAGKAKRIITMNGHRLSAFGPDAVSAVIELNRRVYNRMQDE